MSRVPEIAPEVRALLEEIVADPRSRIRLAPHRALTDWFDGGATVGSSGADATSAEKYLLSAHREAVADMLCDAAKIAFWKAPVLAHRPIEADGLPFDERRAEQAWRPLAERRIRFRGARAEDVELLRQCLAGIQAGAAHALAQASMALVPSDRTRFFVALTLPWDRPRAAISLFERLAKRARSRAEEARTQSSLAARLCAVERIEDARGVYQASCLEADGISNDLFCVFNLSCFLGDERGATIAAESIGQLFLRDDDPVIEAVSLLRTWWSQRSEVERRVASRTGSRLVGRIPEAASALSEAIQS